MMDYEAAIASRGAEVGANMEVDVVGSDESHDDSGLLNQAQSPASDDSDEDEEEVDYSDIVVFRIKEEYDDDTSRGCSLQQCNCDEDQVRANLVSFCKAMIKIKKTRSRMCPRTVQDYLVENTLFGICFKWLELGDINEEEDEIENTDNFRNDNNDPPGDNSSANVLVTNVQQEDSNLDAISSEEESSMSSTVDSPTKATPTTAAKPIPNTSLSEVQNDATPTPRPNSLPISSLATVLDRISSSSNSSSSQVSSPGTPCEDENPSDESPVNSRQQPEIGTESAANVNSTPSLPSRGTVKLAAMFINHKALSKMKTSDEPEEESIEQNLTETPQTVEQDSNQDTPQQTQVQTEDKIGDTPGESQTEDDRSDNVNDASQVIEENTQTESLPVINDESISSNTNESVDGESEPSTSTPTVPVPTTASSPVTEAESTKKSQQKGNVKAHDPPKTNTFAEPFSTVRKSTQCPVAPILSFRCPSPTLSGSSVASSTRLVFDEESRPTVVPTDQRTSQNSNSVPDHDDDESARDSNSTVSMNSPALGSEGASVSSTNCSTQNVQENIGAESGTIDSGLTIPEITMALESLVKRRRPVGTQKKMSSSGVQHSQTGSKASTSKDSKKGESQNLTKSSGENTMYNLRQKKAGTAELNDPETSSSSEKRGVNDDTANTGAKDNTSNRRRLRMSREDGEISEDETSGTETESCSSSFTNSGSVSTVVVENSPRTRQNMRSRTSSMSSNRSGYSDKLQTRSKQKLKSASSSRSSETSMRQTRSTSILNVKRLHSRFAAIEASTKIKGCLVSDSGSEAGKSSPNKVGTKRKKSTSPETPSLASKRMRRARVNEATTSGSITRSRSGSRSSSRSSNSSSENRKDLNPKIKKNLFPGESKQGKDLKDSGKTVAAGSNQIADRVLVKRSQSCEDASINERQKKRKQDEDIIEITLSDDECDNGPSSSKRTLTAKVVPQTVPMSSSKANQAMNILRSLPGNKKTSGYASDDSVSSVSSNVPLAQRLAKRLKKRYHKQLSSRSSTPSKVPESRVLDPQKSASVPQPSKNPVPRVDSQKSATATLPPVVAADEDDEIEIIEVMPPPSAPPHRRKSAPPPLPPKREVLRTENPPPSPSPPRKLDAPPAKSPVVCNQGIGIHISFDAAKTNPIKSTQPPQNPRTGPSNSAPTQKIITQASAPGSEEAAPRIEELEAEDESRRVISPKKTQPTPNAAPVPAPVMSKNIGDAPLVPAPAMSKNLGDAPPIPAPAMSKNLSYAPSVPAPVMSKNLSDFAPVPAPAMSKNLSDPPPVPAPAMSKNLSDAPPKAVTATVTMVPEKESVKSSSQLNVGEKRRPETPTRVAVTVAAQSLKTGAAASPNRVRKNLIFDPREDAVKVTREPPQTNVKSIAEKLQRQQSFENSNKLPSNTGKVAVGVSTIRICQDVPTVTPVAGSISKGPQNEPLVASVVGNSSKGPQSIPTAASVAVNSAKGPHNVPPVTGSSSNGPQNVSTVTSIPVNSAKRPHNVPPVTVSSSKGPHKVPPVVVSSSKDSSNVSVVTSMAENASKGPQNVNDRSAVGYSKDNNPRKLIMVDGKVIYMSVPHPSQISKSTPANAVANTLVQAQKQREPVEENPSTPSANNNAQQGNKSGVNSSAAVSDSASVNHQQQVNKSSFNSNAAGFSTVNHQQRMSQNSIRNPFSQAGAQQAAPSQKSFQRSPPLSNSRTIPVRLMSLQVDPPDRPVGRVIPSVEMSRSQGGGNSLRGRGRGGNNHSPPNPHYQYPGWGAEGMHGPGPGRGGRPSRGNAFRGGGGYIHGGFM